MPSGTDRGSMEDMEAGAHGTPTERRAVEGRVEIAEWLRKRYMLVGVRDRRALFSEIEGCR